jgi:hypothetical protein
LGRQLIGRVESDADQVECKREPHQKPAPAPSRRSRPWRAWCARPAR